MAMKPLTKLLVVLATIFATDLDRGIVRAQAAGDKSGIEVTWRSEHTTPQELSRAFERLYVSLYNTRNLPIRRITDPAKTAQPIATLLRTERLFFGDYFPVGIDAMMCDLNSHICSRGRKGVSSRRLSSVTDHVGGYTISAGKWRNNAKTPVTVPALEFKTYTTIGDLPFDPKVDVAELVASENADCSQWKVSCEKLVLRLNRALFDEKRKAEDKPDTIKLPITGYETRIILADGGENTKGIQFDGIEKLRRQITQEINQLDQATKSWRSYMEKVGSKTKANIQALERNIQSFGAAQYQGFTDPQFPSQNELLQLINHPFSSTEPIPDYLKEPVSIAVLDFAFDKDHCELATSISLDAELQPAPVAFNRPPATECGSVMSSPPNKAQDHGTHVAGLIAAKANNAKGVVGLNPFAKLSYVALDQVGLQDSIYRNQVATKLTTLGIASINSAEPISVANLSWRYENIGGVDAIGRSIDNLRDATLVRGCRRQRQPVPQDSRPLRLFPGLLPQYAQCHYRGRAGSECRKTGSMARKR